MSIASKLLSVALTAGAAVAVGYGLKKLEEKVETKVTPPAEDEREIIGEADSKINLKLEGNHDWSYTLKDKGIVKESENRTENSVHHFQFVPLKDGVTELELDYRAKGSEQSRQTITYNIEVKNGKIIRFDAAGDLGMLVKDTQNTQH